MSKKSPSKLVKCLICKKKTETRKHSTIISFVNYFFPELVAEVETEEDTYMVSDPGSPRDPSVARLPAGFGGSVQAPPAHPPGTLFPLRNRSRSRLRIGRRSPSWSS